MSTYRRPAVRATRHVEPLDIPRSPQNPDYKLPEPTEMQLAMQKKYEEKRAREIAWQNTPDDSPF